MLREQVSISYSSAVKVSAPQTLLEAFFFRVKGIERGSFAVPAEGDFLFLFLFLFRVVAHNFSPRFWLGESFSLSCQVCAGTIVELVVSAPLSLREGASFV